MARLVHEAKFVLPARRVDTVHRLLTALCQPDAEYPLGRIASIYYDTPELALLADKVDSQYLKCKVRVRWYEDPESGRPGGRAWAEMKHRIGSRRHKVRLEMPTKAAWLAAQPLTAGALARLPDALLRAGHRVPQPLLPSVVVRYRRSRFTEPYSGARIALDSSITLGDVHPRIGGRGPRRPIGLAVLEVKWSERRLPPRLRPLASVGCRPAAFSKYGACMAEAMAEAA